MKRLMIITEDNTCRHFAGGLQLIEFLHYEEDPLRGWHKTGGGYPENNVNPNMIDPNYFLP